MFLQHPRESRTRIGTVRMAHLALPDSELHVGTSLPGPPGPRTAVLFPGPGASPPEILAQGDPWTLVVVDGTWPQARKLVERDPVLRALPRIGFVPDAPGNYRIRREPSAECLATVEAVVSVLGRVEGSPERFQSMIAAFTRMVDLQIDAAAARRVRIRSRAGGKPLDRGVRTLRAAGDGLVLLHAEGSAHVRPPEVVHLVALRPSSGAHLDVVVAPGPLATVPRHVGLAPEALLSGEPASVAVDRLRDFLAEGDIVATWGKYPLQLLGAAGLHLRDTLDLRELLARRLRRRPGLLESHHGPLTAAAGRGRAGRRVASLAELARSLDAPA